jgi:hypothetical protein
MLPTTTIGRHRLAVLRRLAVVHTSQSVLDLQNALGYCPRTLRAHLQVLLDLGLVTRIHYRRWHLAAGVKLSGLDGTRLDPGGSNAASR